MEPNQTCQTWLNRKIADTTYLSFRDSRTELLLHTGKESIYLTGAKRRLKHSGVLRIKKDREHPNHVNLHMTLFHENGRDDIVRVVSRTYASAMFAVTGHIGSQSALLRRFPGATNAVNGIFIRSSEYLSFPCPSQDIDGEPHGSFKITPALTELMRRFLETWSFAAT